VVWGADLRLLGSLVAQGAKRQHLQRGRNLETVRPPEDCFKCFGIRLAARCSLLRLLSRAIFVPAGLRGWLLWRSGFAFLEIPARLSEPQR